MTPEQQKRAEELAEKYSQHWGGDGDTKNLPVSKAIMLVANESYKAGYAAALAERELHQEALQEFDECPFSVDQATVPKAGIDAAPEQVVVNMSIAWPKIIKMREALARIAELRGK